MTTRKEKKDIYPANRAPFWLTKRTGTILIVICILVTGLYQFSSLNRYKDEASSDALTLAQSLETLLQTEHIAELTGGTEDLEKPEYIATKNNLSHLVQTTNDIEFAYLMGAKGDDLVFLVDSESPNSPGYSPPGQIYNEAINGVLEVFRIGESVMEGPAADRWGTFYSALVPVKDPNSGQVIAVFGLDFDASEWHADLLHQMNREIIISVLFILFVIAFCRSGYHYLKLKELSDKTTVKEALYRSMFEQAPVGIAIVNDKSFATQSEFGNASMNPAFEKILGRTYRELSNTSWPEITYPDDLQIDLDEFEKFKTGEIDCYTIEKRFLRPDGSCVWTYMKVVHFLEGLRDNPMHLCLLVDITEERNISNSLSESERSKSVLLSNLPGMAYRSSIDRDWTIRVVSAGCYDLTGYTPESLIDNRDLSYNDVIAPEYREILWNEWEYILNEKQRFKLEYEIITASGERKWVTDIGKGIVDEKGEMKAVEGIVFDISEQKNAENRLIYNYEHDSLTGLYSRDYFDNLLIKDHKAKSVKKRALIGINLNTVQTLSLQQRQNVFGHGGTV